MCGRDSVGSAKLQEERARHASKVLLGKTDIVGGEMRFANLTSQKMRLLQTLKPKSLRD